MNKIFVLALSTLAFIPTASAQWTVTPAPREVQNALANTDTDPSEFASAWDSSISSIYADIRFPIDLVKNKNLSPQDTLIYDRSRDEYFTADFIEEVKSRNRYVRPQSVQDAEHWSTRRALDWLLYSAPREMFPKDFDEGPSVLRASLAKSSMLRGKLIQWLTPMFVYNFQRQGRYNQRFTTQVIAEAEKYLTSLTPAKIDCEKKYLASASWDFRFNLPNATCASPDETADATFRNMQAFIFRRVLNDKIPVAELKKYVETLKNKLVQPTAKK
jgi:hypothetical protein